MHGQPHVRFSWICLLVYLHVLGTSHAVGQVQRSEKYVTNATYLCAFNKLNDIGSLTFWTNRLSPCSWYNCWHSYSLHIKKGIPSYQATHHRPWRKESSLTTLIFINHVEVTFKFLFSVFNIKWYQNTITHCVNYNKWNRTIYYQTNMAENKAFITPYVIYIQNYLKFNVWF